MAKRAGVSAATVSRVLNGAPTVREQHRRRVLQAVADLGYRPNRLARSFRRQRAETIGIVVSDIENPHFTAMVRAVEDAAYRRGKRVLLCNTDESAGKQRAYLEVLATERVLGVIMSPSNPAAPEVSQLLDVGIPVVAFDRPVLDPRADSVLVANRAGSELATLHLVSAGHSRVGFVGGPTNVYTGAERLAGYEAAMRRHGLQPCSVNGRFRIEGGRAAMDHLLDAWPDLTGLVIGNNLMAIGALQALRARGVDVPGQLALVAIDDPFWSELVEPALTTLAQPLRAMSESAVELLFERMEGKRTEPRHLVFGFELRVRDSCGTAAPGSWRKRTCPESGS